VYAYNNIASKPDYVVSFQASASNCYVASAFTPHYNIAAVNDAGTGNACVIRQISGSKALVVGANATYGRNGQVLEVNQVGAQGGIAITSWNASPGGGILDFNRTKGSTVGSMAAVAAGDSLGSITFRGASGSALTAAAYFEGQVDGAVSSGIVPGRFTFYTANSSGAFAERLRITSNGDVAIMGGPFAAGVGGPFLHIPAITGTPGTPLNWTGATMVYRSDLNQILIYDHADGVWHWWTATG
jgi:hypothetical protein